MGLSTGSGGRLGPGATTAAGGADALGAAGADGGGVGIVGATRSVGGGAMPASGGRIGCAGRPMGRSIDGAAVAGPAALTSGAVGASTRGSLGAASAAGVAATGCADSSGGTARRSSSSAGFSGTSTPNSRRSLMATSSSIELEWVFFSVTPNSGSFSRISCALTSSSRASSLMRILFINTKTVTSSSCQGAPYALYKPPSSDSP